jgi:DNA-binding NtrC family response regulator
MAATNADLQEAVRTQKLRRDLYYRLNVIPLVLPPLRERRDDIPLLARHFLNKYAMEFEKPMTDFSDSAMQAMMLYDWPGNVRELEHVVERAVVLSEGTVVQVDTIDLARPEEEATASFQQRKARVIMAFERDYLQGLLLTHRGNITRAAEAAGKDRRALRQLIRKHKIDASAYRS